MDLNEIIRLAFLKYRLSGRRSMNTFIFTQAKKNNLTDKEIDKVIDTLEEKIQQYQEETQQEWKHIDFTCNMKRCKRICN